ncbi:glycosyltransferase family 2 protein [Pseudomonadota bacterium]
MNIKLSIIIPAKNEALGLSQTLPKLRKEWPETEILVVDDGSTDHTARVCEANAVKIIPHPYNMGNGAAIKTGARAAKGATLIFMDADGQHRPEDIHKLLNKLSEGYDMVVGARDTSGQASIGRLAANTVYNNLASWMVRHKIDDLTSGFRAVRADKFKEFLHLLPNGFSYPTTCTIAFFRSGYAVSYIPIKAEKREGKSHIKIVRDGVRFLLIIFKIISLYSPLKIFFPLSAAHFALGVGYYMYTFITAERFTNMSALLFTMAIFIFLIGLISEQITMLLYQKRGRE